MMRVIQLCFVVYIVLLSGAHAEIHTGKITQVWAEPSAGDFVMLSVDSKPTPTGDTCAKNGVYHYAFRITEDMGKTLLSMSLSAYAAQKTVRFIGTGTCGIYYNVESLESMRLQ